MSSLHQLIPATTSNTFTLLLLLLLLISIHPHTSSPTNHPSIEPTSYPNPSPTPEPTPNPTALPTPEPTNKPNTPIPTLTTLHPTSDPTEILSPTETPSNIPTSQPTANPTLITISSTLNPTSNTTHYPTTRIPTTGFTTTRFPKTRFPTTNVPTSNSTEITTSTLMPSTDGAQCFIGEQCMKTGECCLGNIEEKKGVHCSCKYKKKKCQYKQCCIGIGYNGCFHDHNCCDEGVPVICSNGKCKAKKKKKHSALINDKDGDNAMLQTFDSVTANDNLIWILIGVSVYFVIMIILFGVYRFVESKKINIYTENEEVGGTRKDDNI